MKHSLTGSTHVIDVIAAALARPAEPASREGRSSALKPTLLERLERALWRSRQREIERTLEGATDVADVEAKLRRFERRTLYRYY